MIRKIKRNEIPDCVEVICKSFMTVAGKFGFYGNGMRHMEQSISEQKNMISFLLPVAI